MKILKQILYFIFFLPLLAYAEYNGNQIKFSIELKDGQKIIGFTFISSIYQKDDSISYKEFLEQNHQKIINFQYDDIKEEFMYYEHRIKYYYSNYNKMESSLYCLTNKTGVKASEIVKFKILDISDQSYAIGFSSYHNWSDKDWMNTQPLETHNIGGFLCSHQIFIHQKTENTDHLIQSLKKISETFEMKTDEPREEFDEAIDKVLQKFKGLKVVIISGCSC